MKKLSREPFRLWLLSVVIGGGLLFFAYVAIQQSLRMNLNEPQLQVAQDIASQLSSGTATPQSVIPTHTIDESKSLAPFVTIVDKNGNVLATSGKIGNITPLPPLSAFSDSQNRTSNWFTWQHDDNKIRDAAVIVAYGGAQPGYVLAARSMSQTESIIEKITIYARWTLFGIIVAPALVILLI